MLGRLAISSSMKIGWSSVWRSIWTPSVCVMLAATAWVTRRSRSGPPPRTIRVWAGKPWPSGKPASASSFLAASGSNAWIGLSSSALASGKPGHQPGLRRDGQGREDALDDRLAVDRLGERQPDPLVVERLLAWCRRRCSRSGSRPGSSSTAYFSVGSARIVLRSPAATLVECRSRRPGSAAKSLPPVTMFTTSWSISGLERDPV